MEMVRDFTGSQVNRLRIYGGAKGSKIGIYYQGDHYMLKFPSKNLRNPDASYINSCICEYIACHIFESLGIYTQVTILGTYNDKLTVACKDFETDGFILKEFAYLKNTIIDSSESGYGTELADVLDTIREQQLVSPVALEEFFWSMFIADALLGNFDRHNGNWGFLINEKTGEVKIAPVFDCGSCLYPQLDESKMLYVLENKKELEDRVYVFPNSALKQDGVKINYFGYLMSTENERCLKALGVIGDRVDMGKIDAIVDDTPYISGEHKLFLKTMIMERKKRIIDPAVERSRTMSGESYGTL